MTKELLLNILGYSFLALMGFTVIGAVIHCILEEMAFKQQRESENDTE